MPRTKGRMRVPRTGKRSRFLAELGVEAPAPVRRRVEEPQSPVYDALKSWRLKRAKADDVPAYVVFHNSTLAEIAERQPRSIAELASVPGVGPTKLERYGEEVLRALEAA